MTNFSLYGKQESLLNTFLFFVKVEEELRRQPVCENGETQTDVSNDCIHLMCHSFQHSRSCSRSSNRVVNYWAVYLLSSNWLSVIISRGESALAEVGGSKDSFCHTIGESCARTQRFTFPKRDFERMDLNHFKAYYWSNQLTGL